MTEHFTFLNNSALMCSELRSSRMQMACNIPLKWQLSEILDDKKLQTLQEICCRGVLRFRMKEKNGREYVSLRWPVKCGDNITACLRSMAISLKCACVHTTDPLLANRAAKTWFGKLRDSHSVPPRISFVAGFFFFLNSSFFLFVCLSSLYWCLKLD